MLLCCNKHGEVYFQRKLEISSWIMNFCKNVGSRIDHHVSKIKQLLLDVDNSHCFNVLMSYNQTGKEADVTDCPHKRENSLKILNRDLFHNREKLHRRIPWNFWMHIFWNASLVNFFQDLKSSIIKKNSLRCSHATFWVDMIYCSWKQ